ncbi:3-phosphoshikimate 1-carboxyvinyltransferase [Thermovibrio ammonificans]|jgi:3-phosphoshikimate 1-carboxyvinyltransferase|uniref:3-phosphoshikimate 1-carboxyvinyltransferase n=1 Tax=Thermovibrio ammonificans (strain DSM 15698 / JCM 12110 / HB-1) TaxID=648996 RepID=E8T5L1_THEA1|nr:3-phosphoshikimate 1-carboxyvinyltransferase [Thermovibrio ammonificans]ADU96486.1 3-phosphoshikimate 1-carboxyvinyltransferase [Thermovibrio ammonificans HB-1]
MVTLHFKGKKLKGELRVPSDKSISHRCIMLGSLNRGEVVVKHFLRSEDCLNTLKAFVELGADVTDTGTELIIKGKGKRSLKEPFNVIDLGNSGTSIRLMAGILAGQPFYSVLTGDRYLRRRPMDRVAVPLRMMGAQIYGREGGKYPPLTIIGKEKLRGISYKSPKASAQVKSSILLAGLFTDETVEVTEPAKSRDHTERMLRAFGVDVEENGLTVRLGKNRELAADLEIDVPADISSAAFFIVGALITPGSEVLLKSVILNPTRTGILDVASRMGADITVLNRRSVSGEEVGDLLVRFTPHLKATVIEGEEIPRLIDELPVIALLATQAEGETVIRDAAELRVKESDRIKSTVENLNAIGACVEELPDGMVIRGKTPLKGGTVSSFGDHRIAMTLAVASLITEEPVVIDEVDSVSTSYPSFFDDLSRLLS